MIHQYTIIIQLLLVVIFPSISKIILPSCNDHHGNNGGVESFIKKIPESVEVPYGRMFMASQFRAGFLFHINLSSNITRTNCSSASKSSCIWSIPPRNIIRGDIRLCSTSSHRIISFSDYKYACTFISFGARLAGPEILLGHISNHTIDIQNNHFKTCIRKLEFPAIILPGYYQLEIYTSYMNEMEEPNKYSKLQPAQERVNEGKAIALSGIGEHSSHIVDRSWTTMNMDGLLLEPCFGKNIGCYKQWYLLQHGRRHRLVSWNITSLLGYTSKDVHKVRAAFVYSLPEGPSLTEHSDATDLILIRNISVEMKSMMDTLGGVQVLSYGQRPWRESQSVGRESGRWVYNPQCEETHSNSNDAARKQRTIPDIHRSRQGSGSGWVWRPYGCRLRHYSPTELHQCLTVANIQFIAGFGDSVGDEQWNNVIALLPRSGTATATTIREGSGSKSVRGGSGGGGGGVGIQLVCNNAADNRNNNIHKYIHRVTNLYGITNCIDKVLSKTPIRNIQNNTTTIVLVTNFMALWMVREHSMAEIIEALHKQANIHAYYTSILLSKGITFKRIFFTGTAIHGYRAAGMTPGRIKAFNTHAIAILGDSGWDVLDVYNMTLARPDGSVDGVHYKGGVASAITDVLLNILCNIHQK
eukprot:gene2064-4037_t